MARRLAILVGNGRFAPDSGLESLRGPSNDVAALAGVLADSERGGFDVQRFVDRPRGDVMPAIEHALGEAETSDLVLLFYAGHGKLDPSGRLCLATAETRAATLRTTSIPVSELRDLLSHTRAGTTVLLLDCCFSGAVGKEFLRGGVDDQLSLVQDAAGLHILTASTALQTARERDVEADGVVMGAFTRVLVEGLASGVADADGDGRITLSDLRTHLRGALRGQTAQYWAHEAGGDPLVARAAPRESPQERRLRQLGAWYAQGVVPDALYPQLVASVRGAGDARLAVLVARLLDDSRMGAAELVAAWEGARRPPQRDSANPPQWREAARERAPIAEPERVTPLTRVPAAWRPDHIDLEFLGAAALAIVVLIVQLRSGDQDDFFVRVLFAVIALAIVLRIIRASLPIVRPARRLEWIPLAAPVAALIAVSLLLAAANSAARRSFAEFGAIAAPLIYVVMRLVVAHGRSDR